MVCCTSKWRLLSPLSVFKCALLQSQPMFFAVILACRDKVRGENLKLSLEENAKEHGNTSPTAEVMLLDVSSLQSVRSFAKQWHQQRRPLHGLINNAGIFDIGSSNAT